MNIFLQLTGEIKPPVDLGGYSSVKTGLPNFISNLILLATTIAGLLVVINFILAGYEFLTAGGDPKKVSEAWKKIWQSLVGLIIVVSAIAIISVVQRVFGISILTPKLYGPGKLN